MANGSSMTFNKQDKNFMWIFDHKDFAVKDILEIAQYDITIDEETNQSSTIVVDKQTTAVAGDIIILKKNNVIIYWGIIDEISNDDSTISYTYSCNYITNLFDQSIALEQNINSSTIDEGYYRFISVSNTNGNMAVKDSSTDESALVQVWSINSLKNGIWEIIKSGTHYKIKNVNSGLYLNVTGSAYTTMGTTLCQSSTGAEFDFTYNEDGGYYNIVFTGKTYSSKNVMVGIDTSVSLTDGTKMQNWYEDGDEDTVTSRQFYLQKTKEPIIWKTGIEDFIKDQIDNNFISSADTFINKTYMEIVTNTHTTKDITVSNVENGIYNLHTYMTNCTQKYNLMYTFEIDTSGDSPKLKMYIDKKKTDDVGIFDFSKAWTSQTINGLTITNNGDGSYKLNGTTTAETTITYTFDSVTFNTTYTLTFNNSAVVGTDSTDDVSVYFIDSSDSSIKMNAFNSYNDTDYSYVNSYNYSTTSCILKICNGVTCSELIIKPTIVETYNKNTELIDINAMAISDYDEVLDTDIVSKVVVLTSSKSYTLYLRTDRETTTDATDELRADGITQVIYTENYDDAKQTALDTIKSNSYNHNISFSLKDVYYPVGTSIKIKTKKGTTYDTYISAVNISDSSFYYYQCGNIRITFLEKLLKERK